MLSQKWYFSKMYRILQASMMAMSLESYSGKLSKAGMMHNGNISELQTLVRHTNGRDGSAFYPNPTASDALGIVTVDPELFGETETGALYRQSKTTGTRFGMSLTQYVSMESRNWPTLDTSDRKGTGPLGSKSHNHDMKWNHLRGLVIEDSHPKPRPLNPDWCELLMGYPIGYTDIEIPDVSVNLSEHQFPAPRNVPQHEFEPSRVTDRKEYRRDRVEALGNAVVPQCILPIAEAMLKALAE